MRVIGTAGHVDHGKSTLVQALSGIHPDRLKEEQEREMTIDLGFAWLTLPAEGELESEEIGIVDVPGHRDFIENMLSGVGGIDAALFVVAADEGVMPQTREHLAILDILQIQGGVVALTKVDLIDDPEWLDLVETDLREVLLGTILEDVPIVRVSAKTNEGIIELKDALRVCLAERPPRPDLGKPRLPIDRVFTIAGFGTVVTGTLSDGSLRLGDDVLILPTEIKGRIRGLQTHKRKEEVAIPGSRTAVNISGVSLDEVNRGEVVTHPGTYIPTQRLDVHFKLLPETSQPIRHNMQVKLFIGAAETIARLRLLGSDMLQPGESGWLQLEPAQPIVCTRGDRYILRRPSPGETLGGGVVVDPHPGRRHKRFSEKNINKLKALIQGTPADILQQTLLTTGTISFSALLSKSNLAENEAEEALNELLEAGQMINISADGPPKPNHLVTSKNHWDQLGTFSVQQVNSYHATHPLRKGIPREELKSRLNPKTGRDSRIANAILEKLVREQILAEDGPHISHPDHEIRFSAEQQRSVDALLARFAASPNAPPTIKDCQTEVGEAVVNALFELGTLVQVGPEVAFRREDYDRVVSDVRKIITKEGSITVAQARDHFNTSRRYVLALLEHLDAIGVTVRDGDVRQLKK